MEIIDAAVGGSLVVPAWRVGGRGFDVGDWGVGQIAVTELGIEELHGDCVCDDWRNMSVGWTRYR